MARGHPSSLRSPQHLDPFLPDLQPAFTSGCNLLLFVVRHSEADRGLFGQLGRFQQPLDGLEENAYFLVVLVHPAGQVFVGSQNTWRKRMKVRTIAMLTSIARLLRSTDAVIATPCSVKA